MTVSLVIFRNTLTGILFLSVLVMVYKVSQGYIPNARIRYAIIGLFLFSLVTQLFTLLRYSFDLEMGGLYFDLIYMLYLYCILMELEFWHALESITPFSSQSITRMGYLSVGLYISCMTGGWIKTFSNWSNTEAPFWIQKVPPKTIDDI